MVETKTIDEDAGKRCDECGKDIYRTCRTHWLARHGEYCSVKCATAGELDLARAIAKIESSFEKGNKR